MVQSDVPQRLDNLPLSLWHLRVLLSLGVAWLLDGFLIAEMGLVGSFLQAELGLSSVQVGGLGTAYLCGCVVGSLTFGLLSDRYGRRKLFLAVPVVYLGSSLGAACASTFPGVLVGVAGIGLGIGGEYAAVNSCVGELTPARVRGTVSLAINGMGEVSGGWFYNPRVVNGHASDQQHFSVLSKALDVCRSPA